MITRLEIESAIKELPEVEVRDLAKWLQEYLEEKWDRQIEADFASGKLDRLITKVEVDTHKDISPLEPSKTYDLPTPYDSFGAGEILMEVLEQKKDINYQEISLKEFYNYVISHRDDDEDFYAYVDRLHIEGNWVKMPALKSPEDLENYPEFIAHVTKKSQT